ncbi:MAG: acyltransferase [Flavobacteriales bacterium]|nr:acyltransferase [Flavobacteriales bacterium]
MVATAPRTKIFGLDLMRVTAGVMVMLSHTGHLVEQHWPRFPNIPYVDWVGLFFVLSGFLIGGLLLQDLHAEGRPMLRFANFMQRRWLRTLPNYFLFLVLNILLVFFGQAPGMLSHATAAYAVFMQNFHLPLDLFFWESWSLAVEEWFYLLFPLIVFGAISLLSFRGERAYLMACLLFITVPIAARMAVLPHVTDDVSRMLWVQKLVLTRLDAPGMGMLAAWFAWRHPKGWRTVRWPAFMAGLSILLLLAPLHFADAPGFMVVGYASVIAASMALLLPLLSVWRSAGSFDKPMRGLSLITYALYLAHLPMLYLFGHLVPAPSAWLCALHYAMFIAATIAIAALIYRFWERPFMRLRDPLGLWLQRRFGSNSSVSGNR